LADREIVVCFIEVIVHGDGLLVVVVRFLEDADHEVCITQILEELSLVAVLEGLLQDHNGLRVTTQLVKGRTFVDVEVEGQLAGGGGVGQLLQQLVADCQALLWAVQLKVEVGEVLGRREVVVSEIEGRL
jgi:hypothetical protein